MIAAHRPPPAYSSDRSSRAPPRPSDWWRGRTTRSDSPHTPSRSMASAAPTTFPSSSATHAPPGSVSSRWAKRTSGAFGGGGGEGRGVEARLEVHEGHDGDVVDGAGVLDAHRADRRHGEQPYVTTPAIRACRGPSARARRRARRGGGPGRAASLPLLDVE